MFDIIEDKQVEVIPETIKNIESIKTLVQDEDSKQFFDKQVTALKSATNTLKKQKEQYKQKTVETEKEERL